MKNSRSIAAVIAFVLSLSASMSRAHGNGGDVYWHIDPNVETCSMVIDTSLTQGQWHRFAKQAGAALSYKSLASARTLGKMNFKIAVDYSSTPVDQRDLAWINTFTHPDEDCPLGDAVVIPTLRGSIGVTDRIDVGAYWTTAPGANYGAVGGEVKYAFLEESERRPVAAVRASVSVLTGVPDFNLNVYSVDLLAGKRLAMFTPYIGLKESLVVGTETTSKVDLNRETLAITQGYAGITYSAWLFNVAAEYDVSAVNTFAIAIGMGR